MKRILAFAFACLTSLFNIFAGDAAAFEDIGFSNDGRYYLFGTYGKTDGNFESWAEIYTVDIVENDFVKDGVFKTKPSACTAGISGKQAYDELKEKSAWKISKYNARPSDVKNLLYVRNDESKSPEDEISFKDFERNRKYRIRLVPTYEGYGKNSKSSFYISMTKEDPNGALYPEISVGSPSIKRKGVTGYKIERIFSDKTGQRLIFVIQKTVQDDTGTSIRYMVEAF